MEITRQRYGFLRLDGLEPEPGDVYISAVAGPPLRASHRATRSRGRRAIRAAASATARWSTSTRSTGRSRLPSIAPSSTQLTPIIPKRRVPLDGEGADVLARAVDLLAPLAFGQRVLVTAPRRAPAARRCCAALARGCRSRSTARS